MTRHTETVRLQQNRGQSPSQLSSFSLAQDRKINWRQGISRDCTVCCLTLRNSSIACGIASSVTFQPHLVLFELFCNLGPLIISLYWFSVICYVRLRIIRQAYLMQSFAKQNPLILKYILSCKIMFFGKIEKTGLPTLDTVHLKKS